MTWFAENSGTHNGDYRWSACLLVTVLMLAMSHPVLSEESFAEQCTAHSSLFDKRLCQERSVRHKPFVLIPHKPNYILASRTNDLEQQNEIYDDYETKFQISFKVPLNKHNDDTKWLWYFGYSQLSVWQMLNFEHSAPFRDTNFEPEIMLYRLTNVDILGWNMKLINLGLLNHQSNGQVPPHSRSWNRSYIELFFEHGQNNISLKAWHRWHEKQKDDPNAYEGDDNPDIEEYIGHGELRIFHAGNNSNVGVIIRNTLHGEQRGSFQFDWTMPITAKQGLRAYIQYFNGYGETLLDYKIKRQRFGIGLMLADWL